MITFSSFLKTFSQTIHGFLKKTSTKRQWKSKPAKHHLASSLCVLALCVSLYGLLTPQQALAAKTPFLGLWDVPVKLDPNAPLAHINPDAQKGGSVTLSAVGTFDNLNPFSPRGIAPSYISLTYEPLAETVNLTDNIIRGVLAESFDLNKDRSVLRIYLRKNAFFADGVNVTAHDVVATFTALTEEASPTYKNMYGDVEKIYAESDHVVVYEFAKTRSRELPIAVCRLPVLPKHLLEKRNLGEPNKELLQGSGPYAFKSVSFGSQFVLERRKDYWGKDLPFNQGRYNFDTIKIDFYRDAGIARQAFFAGDVDFYSEGSVKDWLHAYDTPAIEDGRILKEYKAHNFPIGMMGVVFNTRKSNLSDKNVRQAIGLLLDFEWINRTLLYEASTRCTSYFTGHDFNFQSKPSAEELKLLLPFKDLLDPAVFETLPEIPVTDGSGDIREQMLMAVKLFEKAGWELKNGVMSDKNGKPLHLTFIIPRATYQRTYASFQKNLKRIGIEMDMQLLDQTQYFNRMRSFDYDLLYTFFHQIANPGNEQRNFWTSTAADRESSKNYAGIKDPVIDALTENLIAANTKQEMHIAANALNRTLMHSYYVVPGWFSGGWRTAWWKDRIQPGKTTSTRVNPAESWHKVAE